MRTSRRALSHVRGVGAVLLAISMLLWHSSARAWGYNEHYDLGRDSYVEVCEELKRYTADTLPVNQRMTDKMQSRYDVACGSLSLLSAQYGQFVALSGDHLTIENIRGLAANLAARNFVEYLLLASHNADHFHPLNVELWREYHGKALQNAALAARGETPLDRLDEFWLGFYHSAYADHFLQDAFAAGHSGFNRPSSTPNASLSFHNDLNESGKLLRDSAGRQWRTYGDNHLTIPENVRGRSRVQQAASSSVRDFLITFVTGQSSALLQADVLRRIPSWANQKCNGAQDAHYGELSQAYNQAIDEEDRENFLRAVDAALLGAKPISPIRTSPGAPLADCRLDDERANDPRHRGWHSLLHIHQSAKTAVTHTFGFSHFGRIAPFEAVLGPSYTFGIYTGGIQLGAELGVYGSFRADGNDGVVVGPAASFPLGGKYGTVLAWDLDAKVPVLFPVVSTRGTEYVQHYLPSLGLAMSVQLGFGALRLSGGPALAMAHRLGPGPDRWGTHFGWYAQAGFQLVRAPRGGGTMEPWPF